MLTTMVVASGVLFRPLPQTTTFTAAVAERNTTQVSRAAERPTIPKHLDVDTPRAPRAEEQDPVRVPEVEPPAPTRTILPGGIDGVDVPFALGGTFLVQPGKESGGNAPRHMRVRVEVEEGLPVSTQEFSDFVMAALNDERSWAGTGQFSFSRTDERAAVRIVLASPSTVDAECAPLPTNGKWSCGRYGKAMINADRWINNSAAFAAAGGDIVEYRTYLINHEVGHLLGYDHVKCPAPGAVAPVMMQQSITLSGCVPNGWIRP